MSMVALTSFNSAITAYWDNDARLRFDVPRDEVSAEVASLVLLAEDSPRVLDPHFVCDAGP